MLDEKKHMRHDSWKVEEKAAGKFKMDTIYIKKLSLFWKTGIEWLLESSDQQRRILYLPVYAVSGSNPGYGFPSLYVCATRLWSGEDDSLS